MYSQDQTIIIQSTGPTPISPEFYERARIERVDVSEVNWAKATLLLMNCAQGGQTHFLFYADSFCCLRGVGKMSCAYIHRRRSSSSVALVLVFSRSWVPHKHIPAVEENVCNPPIDAFKLINLGAQ